MSKYHYEIIVDFINGGDEIANQVLGAGDDSRTFYLNTNNRLIKDELIVVSTSRGALINLKITKITRYLFQITDENQLIEMDMNSRWNR